MSSRAALTGWSAVVLLGSLAVTGCSSLLGYEDTYDDALPGLSGTGALGGAAGAGGASGASAGIGGASAGNGGGGGKAGGGGSVVGGKAGAAGAGQGGSGGAAGGAGLGGTSATGGGGTAGNGGGNLGGAAGQAGAGGAMGGAGGGQAGVSGSSAGAGASGASGQSGAGGAGAAGGTATGGSGGASGSAGSGGSMCAVPTAPASTCGVDLATDPSHCGACGLSCGASSSCAAGRCDVDPPTAAPFRLTRSFFVEPLAYTPTADRLLFREETSLYEAGLSGDLPSPALLLGGTLDVGGVSHEVQRWKSARFGPNNSVVAIGNVQQAPPVYPAFRHLVQTSRSGGPIVQVELAGDDQEWDVFRHPAGGMLGAQDTFDAPVVVDKRVIVWDYDDVAKAPMLSIFDLPLVAGATGKTFAAPRYNFGRVVGDGTYVYFPSQTADGGPFKLKRIKVEAVLTETDFWSGTLTRPTDLVLVKDALFVLDAGGDPAAPLSPKGRLLRFDLRGGCPIGPTEVATGLQRAIALAADDTRVYVLEVRADGQGTTNVVSRRFHDGTGAIEIVHELRGQDSLSDGSVEKAERLGKAMIPAVAYGQELLLFGLGSDPAKYRPVYDVIFGVPRLSQRPRGCASAWCDRAGCARRCARETAV